MSVTLEKAPNMDANGRVVELNSKPNAAQLKRAMELLRQSKRPVIIAGDQVDKYGAVSVLSELAIKLGAVVLREPRRSLTRFTISSDHPHFAGEYHFKHPAVLEADCIFAVGCKVFLEFSLPNSPEIPSHLPLIHLHDDPKEIANIYAVHTGLLGDTKAALEELLLHQGEHKSSDWAEAHHHKHLAELEQEKKGIAGKSPMSVTELVSVLSDLLPSDIILVDEGIRSSRPLMRHFPFRVPNSFHSTAGGALGWGIPAAVGLQLAQPGRRVLAFVGDGSALFTLQALWTAARYKLPVIFLIVNNGGYLAVKASIQEFSGKGAHQQVYPASSLHSPDVDFVHLAEGYGVKGSLVLNKEQLEAAIQEALNVNEPRLIEVRVAEEPV
jgi:benzoylformate decarboxylase